MSRSRGPRVLRGVAAASVATFVALLSHIVAGGDLPSWVGILVPWMLAILTCIGLAGRTLSIVRLTASVAMSQLFFHVLFVLGAGGTADAPVAAHAHGSRGLVLEAAGLEFADVGMSGAHIVAALATVAVLYRGESAIRGIVRLCTELRVATHRRISALVSGVSRLESVHLRLAAVPHAGPRPLGRFAAAIARRGPPALSAV